uniref:Choline/ethanolaminephosphotransferase 1-like n=1 Tax=Saccoglossus kowalevskii TaxID=10224 RepID=A0ABM0MUK0_SACKO
MILTSDHLKNLSEFVYSSDDLSICGYLMQPFWNWLCLKIPHWVAPTTLSTIGIFINTFTTLVVLFFCPSGSEQAPSWVYILCAVGLFLYQTVDSLDGKQERKIDFLASLSDMFDHGFDSVSNVLLLISFGCVMQLGHHSTLLFCMWASGMFMFYVVHWTTYVTGVVMFCRFDVTEAQLVVIIIFLLTAVFGPGIWAYKGSHAIGPIVPIATVLILTVMSIHNSTSAVYEKHPCLFLLAYGIVAAKYINKYV